MLFACTQPYIERNLTDEQKLQMKELNQGQMMAPPQEQKIIECEKTNPSGNNITDKSYHFGDFLVDMILPKDDVCEEVDPDDRKSSIQRADERLIGATIERQMKEALEKIDKKE